jgi:uncharacterized protein with HEPN domain
MTDRSSSDHLEDILDAAEKAQAFAEGTTYESFVDDDKSVFAVIRALEVVGEATKRLPQPLRDEYPQVPWSSMAGMRDNLIHDYSDVDRQLVWRTVQDELPEVRRHLRMILEEMES